MPMNVIFGVAAMAIGMVSLVKLNSLPAVILALVLGALVGELLNVDFFIKRGFQSVIDKLHFDVGDNEDEYMKFYLIVAVTFCASGTNIFGAINEVISGDMTILLSKAVMDIFASAIFASTLGFAMNLIVIPQFVILCCCFYGAGFIAAVTTPAMLMDFVAVGGIMTFVLGLNIAKIKDISAANLLPALVFVWPCSLFFGMLFG